MRTLASDNGFDDALVLVPIADPRIEPSNLAAESRLIAIDHRSGANRRSFFRKQRDARQRVT
jgi:hypothetical protein